LAFPEKAKREEEFASPLFFFFPSPPLVPPGRTEGGVPPVVSVLFKPHHRVLFSLPLPSSINPRRFFEMRKTSNTALLLRPDNSKGRVALEFPFFFSLSPSPFDFPPLRQQ